MKTFLKVVLAGLVAALASGCASLGDHSEEEIEFAVQVFAGSYACGKAGFFDQNTSAKGIAYAQSKVYKSETARFRAKGEQMLRAGAIPEPTAERCKDLETRILAGFYNQQLQSGSSSQQSTVRTTNCSTYFGQTHCTSY